MSLLVTREMLAGYLDDALGETDIAHIEAELRKSEPLRQQLRAIQQERDRGEHSVGAIWRRRRLSCPTREQLGSYLLGALADDVQQFLVFHLDVIRCRVCAANLADLEAQQAATGGDSETRRRKYFQSSAGLLRK